MSLVPLASSSGNNQDKGLIVAIRGAQELTQEEYDQRIKDVRPPLPNYYDAKKLECSTSAVPAVRAHHKKTEPPKWVTIPMYVSFYSGFGQAKNAFMQAEVLEEKLKFITEKIPTRIMNVAGSNAGAGSGEFHMYRQVGALALCCYSP